MGATSRRSGADGERMVAKEIWRPVVGYEGLYEVSNYARIRSLPKYNMKNSRILHPTVGKRSGRVSVMLSRNPTDHKRVSLHRIVAMAFVHNPNEGKYTEINHKDENPKNNLPDNLEWCDRKYNMNYNGLQKWMHEKIRKPVIGKDKEGNEIYFSSLMEAKKNGYDSSCITRRINGQAKSKLYKGYEWRYANGEL